MGVWPAGGTCLLPTVRALSVDTAPPAQWEALWKGEAPGEKPGHPLPGLFSASVNRTPFLPRGFVVRSIRGVV